MIVMCMCYRQSISGSEEFRWSKP